MSSLRLYVFKTWRFGQFYCSSSVTVVPAQYLSGRIWRLAFWRSHLHRAKEKDLSFLRTWGLNCNTFITLITRATFMPWRVTRRRRRSNRVVFNIWRSLVQVLLSPYRYLDFFLEVAGSYPRPRHETIQQVSLSPVEILHSFYSICNICSFICSVLNYRNCAKYI